MVDDWDVLCEQVIKLEAVRSGAMACVQPARSSCGGCRWQALNHLINHLCCVAIGPRGPLPGLRPGQRPHQWLAAAKAAPSAAHSLGQERPTLREQRRWLSAQLCPKFNSSNAKHAAVRRGGQ
jgi:hypothetical protein